MQTETLLSRYQQILDQCGFQFDDVQYQAVLRLEAVRLALIQRQTARPSGIFHPGHFFLRYIRRRRPNLAPVPGVYLWGGVGRGKTWLMDLFFQSVPGERKRRLHFHHFMRQVHEMLARQQGNADPLEKVADNLSHQLDVLCFDEFFVADIADAMLLGTLMTALFQRGITLVATSNIPPDALYLNGLQRDRFLPAIRQIKQHCHIQEVDAGTDYRLLTSADTPLWLYPLSRETLNKLDQRFIRAGGSLYGGETTIRINHRDLSVRGVAQGVLAINFAELCGAGHSQDDYIVLAQRFHTVLLYGVPVMDNQMEEAARRFLALIDEFYACHVTLMVAAEAHFSAIYCGQRLVFEYPRCLSRLQAMQNQRGA